jgi:hypothetical protein
LASRGRHDLADNADGDFPQWMMPLQFGELLFMFWLLIMAQTQSHQWN